MNEIFPTIYEKVPTYVAEDFLVISSQLIIFQANLDNAQMPITDKWYINYN